MKNLLIKFSWQFLATFLLFSCGRATKICKPGQVNSASQHFHVTARNVSRLKENIVLESNVLDWLECGALCLDSRFCVGYNFKKKSTEGQINCQLTHTGDQTFKRISTEDNDWTFYKTAGKKISGCEEENECQNGGKMVWHPVKPFRCECRKNYSGEYCEKYDTCSSSPCLNNGSCVVNGSTGYLCTCLPGHSGPRCEKTHSSCKDVLDNNSSAVNGVYYLKANENLEMFSVYCHMTSLSGKCGGGGWTLVMKLDRDKKTFEYNSRFWENKTTWNVEGGLKGLTENEAKLASYHNTPFTKLCLGMTWDGVRNWLLVNYFANSLYSVIANGNYSQINAGRAGWISLINDAKLQRNCNKEGFNMKLSHYSLKLRMGIAGNNENDCESCDSVIGFGMEMNSSSRGIRKWSSGNIQFYPQSQKKTFGYIFVQ